MSGGSYDYAYQRVREVADQIDPVPPPVSDLRRRFAEHLHLVAQAMHDIEWVDSGDYGPGDEDAAIRAVLGPDPVAPVDPGEPPPDGAVAQAAKYAATTALGPDEIAAILDRHAVGMRTYGVPLTTDTPIDARVYAREEALDLVIYGTLMVMLGDARGEWVRYHGVDALLRLR